MSKAKEGSSRSPPHLTTASTGRLTSGSSKDQVYKAPVMPGVRRFLHVMKYEAIEPRSKAEIECAISQDNPDELLDAVVSVALYSDDPEWAQGVCVRLAKHEHFNVRGNAILGFGHIARVHRQLNENRVRTLIEAALKDENEYIRGQAEAAADDVEFFLKWKVQRPERVVFRQRRV